MAKKKQAQEKERPKVQKQKKEENPKTAKRQTQDVKRTPDTSRTYAGNPWIISTGILAILLVASVFTGGFGMNQGCNDLGCTVDSIDQIMNASSSDAAKASLEDAKASIESAITAQATATQQEDSKDSNQADKSISGDKEVSLDMYVMSQCPYGVQAEDGAIPAIKELQNIAELNIHYIADDNGDGTFSSLHGQPEVDENIRQLCIEEHYPEKFLDYLTCVNKDYQNAEGVWEDCANDNGIDTETIRTCFDDGEGAELLKASIDKTKEVEATGSPTIYINGEPYSSGRDTMSFTRAICSNAEDAPECEDIPECMSDADCQKEGFIGTCNNAGTKEAGCEYTKPDPVEITILNDKDCEGCDTSSFDNINDQIFINTDVTTVDISSDEGQALIEKMEPVQIPAYFFGESVKDAPEYARLEAYFTEKEGYYVLSPSIISQYVSSPKMIGRQEAEGKLDLFVMSQCPYGVQAVDNSREVVDSFGEDIDFNIHFIATDNGDGTFTSLHGQPEVDENIRQVCVMDMYPKTYMDYITCINQDYQNAGSIWEGCATDSGMDTDAIRECSEGDKGAALLKENIALTEELGIGSSPTFLLNNQSIFKGALPADQIKDTFCGPNPDLEGCDTELSTETAVPAGGSC